MNPVVKTREGKYTPERLVKHEWGVVMIYATEKISIPWHRIVKTNETIPREDAPGPITQSMVIPDDDGEVIE